MVSDTDAEAAKIKAASVLILILLEDGFWSF